MRKRNVKHTRGNVLSLVFLVFAHSGLGGVVDYICMYEVNERSGLVAGMGTGAVSWFVRLNVY